jgi:hypothetical protein
VSTFESRFIAAKDRAGQAATDYCSVGVFDSSHGLLLR